jgi:alpha-tubulin suppressor-like RCC1 family protein
MALSDPSQKSKKTKASPSTLYAWGDNQFGQLGLETKQEKKHGKN